MNHQGLHVRDRTSSVQHPYPGMTTIVVTSCGKPSSSSCWIGSRELRHHPCDLGSNSPWTWLRAGPGPGPGTQGTMPTVFPCSREPGCTEASRTMAFRRHCADSLPSKTTDWGSAQSGFLGQARMWKQGEQHPQLCSMKHSAEGQLVGDG